VPAGSSIFSSLDPGWGKAFAVFSLLREQVGTTHRCSGRVWEDASSQAHESAGIVCTKQACRESSPGEPRTSRARAAAPT
jgi:hypothetical protein